MVQIFLCYLVATESSAIQSKYYIPTLVQFPYARMMTNLFSRKVGSAATLGDQSLWILCLRVHESVLKRTSLEEKRVSVCVCV